MSRLRRNAPVVLLFGALFAAAAMTLIFTSKLTFYQDTWDFLINRRDLTVDALLQPHNEHIVVIPVLVEQAILRLFGMSDATPEYILLTLGLLGTAVLLFVYVRRRVGPWLALFATVLVLFLGSAWEVLLWPFEISFIGSIFFGIAMLLALDREDRKGDLLACGFLLLSFGFSSLGIPFAVAAAVAVLQGHRDRGWSRAYLVAIPAILFAAWYIGWGHTAETHVALRNVLASTDWVAKGLAMAVGSVFGLDMASLSGPSEPAWGRVILVGLVIAFAYRQIRKPGFSPTLWPVAAAGAANWFLGAFNQAPGRDPTASRYQYAGAIFVLMILANLLQGVRLSRKTILAAATVTLLAVGPGIVTLNDARKGFEQQTVLTKADLAALEIAHRTVNPEFGLAPEIAGTPSLVNVAAGQYLTAIREYGSPAYSPAELASAPEEGRRQADVVLSQALPISTVTRLGAYSPGGGDENCVSLDGEGAATSDVPISAGLTRIELAPGPDARFSLRRFAVGEYPVPTEGAPGNSVTMLRIPRDITPRPWHLHLDATQSVRVCR
jgi:hypothetical protein